MSARLVKTCDNLLGLASFTAEERAMIEKWRSEAAGPETRDAGDGRPPERVDGGGPAATDSTGADDSGDDENPDVINAVNGFLASLVDEGVEPLLLGDGTEHFVEKEKCPELMELLVELGAIPDAVEVGEDDNGVVVMGRVDDEGITYFEMRPWTEEPISGGA